MISLVLATKSVSPAAANASRKSRKLLTASSRSKERRSDCNCTVNAVEGDL